MNLPNKLTVLRVVMIPFFVVFMLTGLGGDYGKYIALAIFIIASLTDLLDGKIARKHGLVTDLGKVMDPYADTLSHLTFFVCFMDSGLMPVWAFLIIMWREFTQLFMRMLMMGVGKAVPANIWGKSKTVLYAVTSILSIAYIVASAFIAEGGWNAIAEMILYVFYVLSAVAALLSFVTYLSAIIKSKALSGMTI